MSQSPRLSDDAITYLKTFAKLESLSSNEQNFDFFSSYEDSLRRLNSRSNLSSPETIFSSVAVEGVESSTKNTGKMEIEEEQIQEESVKGVQAYSENVENQQPSTKDCTPSDSQQRQIQVFPDSATCFNDPYNHHQDDHPEKVLTNDNSGERRGYMIGEDDTQAPDSRIQQEQDSSDHMSQLTLVQTASQEEEEEKQAIDKKAEEKEERKAKRQNDYHNHIRFLTKDLGFLLETNQEKLMKLSEEKMRLNKIDRRFSAQYLQLWNDERERFNVLLLERCGARAESVRSYLLGIIGGRKGGETNTQRQRCEALIATKNDVKRDFHFHINDSEELGEKKRGARLAVEVYFKNKFYEHWVSEIFDKLERSKNVYAEPTKRLFTKEKSNIYRVFVPIHDT